MRKFLGLSLVSLGLSSFLAATPAGAPTVPAAAVAPHPVRTADRLRSVLVREARVRGISLVHLRSEWQRVAVCEVGGNWAMVGPSYSGIGFLNTTWRQFGGLLYAPYAGQATRDQQIFIGMRVTQGWIPDQYGCSPTGW